MCTLNLPGKPMSLTTNIDIKCGIQQAHPSWTLVFRMMPGGVANEMAQGIDFIWNVDIRRKTQQIAIGNANAVKRSIKHPTRYQTMTTQSEQTVHKEI